MNLINKTSRLAGASNTEMSDWGTRQEIYSGDGIRLKVPGYHPVPQQVPYGAEVEGVYFDGYPQIVK